jgi:hypothetical protein
LSFGWDDAVGLLDAKQRLQAVNEALRNVLGTE